MNAKREPIKILSPIEMDMPCSEHLRLFLAMEAQVFDRPLNSHINFILKQYLGVEATFIKASPILTDFFEQAFAKHDARLNIHLYQSVVDEGLPNFKPEAMKLAIENALRAYLAWALQDESARSLPARQIAQKVQKNMQKWEGASS